MASQQYRVEMSIRNFAKPARQSEINDSRWLRHHIVILNNNVLATGQEAQIQGGTLFFFFGEKPINKKLAVENRPDHDPERSDVACTYLPPPAKVRRRAAAPRAGARGAERFWRVVRTPKHYVLRY
jgi:hypothetical protein